MKGFPLISLMKFTLLTFIIMLRLFAAKFRTEVHQLYSLAAPDSHDSYVADSLATSLGAVSPWVPFTTERGSEGAEMRMNGGRERGRKNG